MTDVTSGASDPSQEEGPVRERANVLGVGVDAVNPGSAVERLITAAKDREKGYVCVTGVHGIMESLRDNDLRKIHNQSLLTTPDGMPTVWIGRAQGYAHMERVYGPDLMLNVCRASVGHGLTHFLYGGGPGVAEELAKALQRKVPGVDVVGTYTPPFRPLRREEERGLSRRLDHLRPDFFWVGLSTPKQERFMAEYSAMLQATVFVGVGAAFDFHTGRVPQAPKLLQKMGLEWLFRMWQEPRRLGKRYLRNNPAFLWHFFMQATGLKRFKIQP